MLGNFFRTSSGKKQSASGEKTLKLTVLPQAEAMEIKEIT